MSEHGHTYDEGEVIEGLRTKGYRVTPQRLTVARVLLTSKGHISAEILYERVRQTTPTISLATVYDSLEALENAGLVTSFLAEPGKKVYDSDTEPHVNLVCTVDGEVVDIPLGSAELGKIYEAAKSSGFSHVKISVTVHGICPRHAETNSGNFKESH